MKSVSYSQYSMWMECPLEWQLSYVQGLRDRTQNISTLFGTACHDTIQYWIKEAFKNGLKKANRLDLDDKLYQRMIALFSESVTTDENGNKIFPCTKPELIDHYKDGCQILSDIRDSANKLFDIENWLLVGVEFPLEIMLKGNLKYKGFLDIVLKDKNSDQIKIIDLKTSTKGWTKYQKTSPAKINQLLLYKKFYSELFDLPQEEIVVEFVILKRKLWENSDFPQKRISRFEPSNGKPSIRKASESFDKFINECFTEDGEYKTDNIVATPSDSVCRFCQFSNDPSHCDKSVYLSKNRKPINQ